MWSTGWTGVFLPLERTDLGEEILSGIRCSCRQLCPELRDLRVQCLGADCVQDRVRIAGMLIKVSQERLNGQCGDHAGQLAVLAMAGDDLVGKIIGYLAVGAGSL